LAAEERARLSNLVDDMGKFSWSRLQEAGITDRPRIQCYDYHRLNKLESVNKPFTAAEDKRLVSLIRKAFDGNYPEPTDQIPFYAISKHMNPRSRLQLRNRWKTHLAHKYKVIYFEHGIQHPWTAIDTEYLLVRIWQRQPRTFRDIMFPTISKTWTPTVTSSRFRQLYNLSYDSHVLPFRSVLTNLFRQAELTPNRMKAIACSEDFIKW